MSLTYKRLIDEYNKINYLEENLCYKLYTINSGDVMFRCDIDLLYIKKKYKIKIYYNKLYPFEKPLKLEINNNNLFDLHNKIISKNNLLINNYTFSNSILYSENWDISMNIIDIIQEVKNIIDYNELYIKRILLNKIINTYTNQHLDYLEEYLI